MSDRSANFLVWFEAPDHLPVKSGQKNIKTRISHVQHFLAKYEYFWMKQTAFVLYWIKYYSVQLWLNIRWNALLMSKNNSECYKSSEKNWGKKQTLWMVQKKMFRNLGRDFKKLLDNRLRLNVEDDSDITLISKHFWKYVKSKS